MAGQAENGCKWHFAEQTGGTDIGPNDAMSQIFKKDKYRALVRESIQNSLDAVYDRTKPVEVHFTISSVNGSSYPNLFHLSEHIMGCLEMYPGDDSKKRFMPMMEYLKKSYYERLRYLQVSDYNTKGMNYSKDDPESPFYAFVRSRGVSAKNNNSAGGAFGFGKAAYFNVSRLSTVFISTKVVGGGTFFEGESYLCTHRIENQKLVDTGFYDNNYGEPITDASQIPNRFLREEPGTDISIIGLNDEDTKESVFSQIKEAVLLDFWLSILDKKLVVNVGDERIDDQNIESILDGIFPDLEDKKRGYGNPHPYFDAVKNAEVDSRHLLIKRRLPRLGDVSLYVYKSKKGSDKIQLMRSPRMLVKAQKNNSNYGFFGVFLCDDPRGNRILRTMEGPAHNEWDWKNDDFAPKEAKAAQKELTDFITDTLVDIFSSKNSINLDIAGLEDYLYIPMANDDDDTDYEVTDGQPTGEVRSDGTSMTTDIHNSDTDSEPEQEHAVGSVITQTPTKMKSSPDNPLTSHKNMDKSENSESRYENSENSKEENSGDKKKSSVDNSRNDMVGEPSVSDETPTTMKYSTYIDVTYRSFAFEKDGKIIHRLIIRSPHDVREAKAVIWAVGEQNDDEVEIKASSLGIPRGTSIEGLPLSEGKNVVDVEFESNMKMTLKLVAYE